MAFPDFRQQFQTAMNARAGQCRAQQSRRIVPYAANGRRGKKTGRHRRAQAQNFNGKRWVSLRCTHLHFDAGTRRGGVKAARP
jgi:hypothetical protein